MNHFTVFNMTFFPRRVKQSPFVIEQLNKLRKEVDWKNRMANIDRDKV
jgi:hypothetical protein